MRFVFPGPCEYWASETKDSSPEDRIDPLYSDNMAMLESSLGHAWPCVSTAVGFGPEDPHATAESPSGQGSVPLSRVSWASDGAGSWDGTDLTGQEVLHRPEVSAPDSDQMEQRLRQQRDRNRQ